MNSNTNKISDANNNDNLTNSYIDLTLTTESNNINKRKISSNEKNTNSFIDLSSETNNNLINLNNNYF